jgi:hypothetical protein
MDVSPGWITAWIIVSGLAFLFSLILNVVLIFVALKAWGQIGPLVKDVQGVVKTVGEKANSITTTAKSTVDNISSKTTHILGSAEDASAEVARKVSAASAAITAIFVVTRVVGALRGMQAAKK